MKEEKTRKSRKNAHKRPSFSCHKITITIINANIIESSSWRNHQIQMKIKRKSHQKHLSRHSSTTATINTIQSTQSKSIHSNNQDQEESIATKITVRLLCVCVCVCVCVSHVCFSPFLSFLLFLFEDSLPSSRLLPYSVGLECVSFSLLARSIGVNARFPRVEAWTRTVAPAREGSVPLLGPSFAAEARNPTGIGALQYGQLQGAINTDADWRRVLALFHTAWCHALVTAKNAGKKTFVVSCHFFLYRFVWVSLDWDATLIGRLDRFHFPQN